jgi:hypothetical protein
MFVLPGISKRFVHRFEQMLRRRINYHRSDLMKINVEPNDARDFSQTFYCILGKFLSKSWVSFHFFLSLEMGTNINKNAHLAS